jgi:hypothetical protein
MTVVTIFDDGRVDYTNCQNKMEGMAIAASNIICGARDSAVMDGPEVLVVAIPREDGLYGCKWLNF